MPHARHRIRSSLLPDTPTPSIDTDGDLLRTFGEDAAHFPGGVAGGVAFPGDAAEVSALIRHGRRILAVGAQSSLTGGATPRGGLVISTRGLTYLGVPQRNEVRVGAGVPLQVLQRHLAAHHLYYPPVPTFDGAFVGGTIATNAAGAATFKYGTTRRWIAGITVILADGSRLDLRRGDVIASAEGFFDIEAPSGAVARVPVPRYTMPAVPKLSAGYFAEREMDLVDLFVGSEGTLGVIVEATLRLVPRPLTCSALVECAGDAEAVAITAALRAEAHRAWRGEIAADIAAIEFMDGRSLALVADTTFARAGVRRPRAGSALLLVQMEVPDLAHPGLERLAEVLDASGAADPVLALPGDEAGAARLFELREAVPAAVNAEVGRHKARLPNLQKTAGDMIVPFERLAESLVIYRSAFEQRHLSYAIWGHVSDGNLHPNVMPTTIEEMTVGMAAIREIGAAITAIGGAPLAEHGVGRSPLKQQLLRDLYGNEGIEQMRAVKRALDPGHKLAPGVLFAETLPSDGGEQSGGAAPHQV